MQTSTRKLALMPMTRAEHRRNGLAVALGLVICFAILIGGGIWAKQQFTVSPAPLSDRCVLTDATGSTTLTPEQAKYAAIIVGTATRRGLAPRAGIIAVATALQESGIRNLDYGDRDSVGLFQQRPSQGWGTEEQLMDPYYASNAFYAQLEKVADWESGDINDVAQEVQRSGVPEGYRKHVPRATIIGDVVAGQGGTVSCLDKSPLPGNAAGYVDLLDKVYGFTSAKAVGQRVSFDTKTVEGARALAALALLNTHDLGVVGVSVGGQAVTTATSASPKPWSAATPPGAETHVEVTFRS